ncbi:hypothetical protein DID80_01030 [Candidatus Marinamargulisbacteria bacterium SCGC AAA071-K20]|nr:hypothetical protein DID80_01030 [Candidatus Marinamargulisbacteria bacterium SCGC AAA071-K20]
MSGEIKLRPKGQPLLRKYFTIFFMFVVLIYLAMFFYMRYTQRNIAKDLASDVIVEINRGIIEKTTNFLMPAVIVAETGTLLSESKALDLNNQLQLEHYSEAVLKPYPQFAAFYYGDIHGNFVMTKRIKDGYSTKIIKANSIKTVYKDKWLSGGVKQRRVENKIDYDPRERPWFIGAKNKGERFWTDIYIFFTDKKPGITASYPVYSSKNHFSGSFGVDIKLSELSNFLNVNSIGNDGIIFIVNDNNKLIAFPKGSSDFKASSGEVVDIVSLDSSRIKKAMSAYQSKDSETFIFDDNSRTYIGAISHFPETFDKEWRIVLIAPLSYFVDITTNPLFEYLAILLLLVFAYIFASFCTSVTKAPFSRVLILVKQFRNGDFKGRVEKTNIREIDEVIEEINLFGDKLDSV